MECRPPPTNNHNHIIVVINYFTKWVEGMPMFNNTMAHVSLFFFNCVIAMFGV